MIEIKNKYNTLLLYKKYPTILKKKILASLLKNFNKKLYQEFLKTNRDIKKIPNINLIYFDEFLVYKRRIFKT